VDRRLQGLHGLPADGDPLPIEFSEQIIDPKNERGANPSKLMMANYPFLVRDALIARRSASIRPTGRSSSRRRQPGFGQARVATARSGVADPAIIGTTANVWVSARLRRQYRQRQQGPVDLTVAEANRRPIRISSSPG
jgi:phosphate transport system permease protein